MTDNEVMDAVNRHHWYVHDKGYEVVMTVLIGSNNYDLDTPESDIDTFSFVMPTLDDLSFYREAASGEFEVEDGKCMYKDIRLALNLLKKTSPNSIECFVGKYRVYGLRYRSILEKYLENDDIMNKMVHCNYSHMLYAMAGMSHQLTKRNMPAGKRYSHALRLLSMADVFVNSIDHRYLLKLLPRDYDEAFNAKRDQRELEYYNSGCVFVSSQLDKLRDEFELTPWKRNIEKEGLALIEQFQRELITRFLKEELI